MSQPRILRQSADGICALTLNRPEKHNALDTQAFLALDAELAALEQQTHSVGCVVLRGSGRSFCAGADLGTLGMRADGAPVDPRFKPGVIDRLGALPQPVIACVHGACMTGGLELALACDFIVADASARFADTHGRWGLVGAWGMMQRLPRRIGVAAARRMMMTSCELDASEAAAIGLVDRVVHEQELHETVAVSAAELLANSWHTNFAVKKTLRETEGMSLAAALAYEFYNAPGVSLDHYERVAKFTTKKHDG